MKRIFLYSFSCDHVAMVRPTEKVHQVLYLLKNFQLDRILKLMKESVKKNRELKEKTRRSKRIIKECQ